MKSSRKSIKVTATACDSKAVTITIVANGITVKIVADSATITIDDAEVCTNTSVGAADSAPAIAITPNHLTTSERSHERVGALDVLTNSTPWRLPRRTSTTIPRPPPF